MNRLRSRLSLASTGLLVAALAGGTLSPAYADSRNHALPPTSSAAQSALVDQYGSLSGALINLYARNSGQTLAKYLASQKILLTPPSLTDPAGQDPATDPNALPTDAPTVTPTGAPSDTATELPATGTPGSPAPDASSDSAAATLPTVPALGTADVLGAAAASATPVNATTLTGLNQQLAAAGLTVSAKGYTSLDALARSVVAKSNTADGAVTLAGAKWMSSLATLRTPKLSTPDAAMPLTPGVPKNALVFGLFADKSLTNLVNSNPGLFTSANGAGLGSPAMASAWNKSMLAVYNSSRDDFSKVLPDPCTGGMLAVMASGKASSAQKVSGAGCSSACVAGGLYLNSQTTSLFAPGTGSTFGNPYSSLWNSTTLNGMQRWQQKQLLAQNPKLTNQLLNDTQPTASASCSASSKATSNALGATLPGIFGQLRTH